MSKLLCTCLLFILAMPFVWADELESSTESIIERIKPIGEVQIGPAPNAPQALSNQAPQTTEVPPQTTSVQSTKTPLQQAPTTKTNTSSTQVANQAGEKIYKTYCHVCHETGITGAPKFGDAKAWTPRIKEGIPTLVKHAIMGYKLMPPKGTCINCTDQDIESAVKYMVSNSQKK